MNDQFGHLRPLRMTVATRERLVRRVQGRHDRRFRGNTDLIEDEPSRHLFPLEDEAGIAFCIAGLLVVDPSRMTALGRAERERLERHSSLRSDACSYADLYRELLGRV